MPAPLNRRSLRLAIAIAIAIAMFGVRPAAAHTEVQSATPGPGQEVAGAIDEIVLTFLDRIMPGATVEVSGPSGTVAATGEAGLDGRILRLPIESTDDLGDYVVRYSFTALDGDHQDEAYRFRIVESDSTVLPPGALLAVFGGLGALAAALVQRRGVTRKK